VVHSNPDLLALVAHLASVSPWSLRRALRILSNKFSESTSVPTLGSELFLKEETFKKSVNGERTTRDGHVCMWQRYRARLELVSSGQPICFTLVLTFLSWPVPFIRASLR
jgi:hypothetical protein